MDSGYAFKYIFIFHHLMLFIVLSFDKRAYPDNLHVLHCHIKPFLLTFHACWLDLVVRCQAGKQGNLGSIPLRLSSLQKVVVCGCCLVTLSLTINETLKWLSLLPTLLQESFWWWQCNNRYIISLLPPTHTPFSPSLINLMISVDV